MRHARACDDGGPLPRTIRLPPVPVRITRLSWILVVAFALVTAALLDLFLFTRVGACLLRVPLEAAGGHADIDTIAGTQAIAVLGGRTDRVHSAARLQRETGLPVLVSGMGTGDSPYRAESEKMAEILRTQYGIEPRWVEASSIDTEQNAIFSWCLVADRGIHRIALVTDPSHMLRARLAFESVGFQVVPAPAAMPPSAPLRWRDLLPSPEGRQEADHVLKEWIGSIAMLLTWGKHHREACRPRTR